MCYVVFGCVVLVCVSFALMLVVVVVEWYRVYVDCVCCVAACVLGFFVVLFVCC